MIAGKPYWPMAQLVRAILGETATLGAVMVGDRPSTDGLFAGELGCRYAQVWSGVTPHGTAIDPVPDLAADDLGHVVSRLLES